MTLRSAGVISRKETAEQWYAATVDECMTRGESAVTQNQFLAEQLWLADRRPDG